MNNPLLKVENLRTNFYTYEGVVKALDRVSFNIQDGKTVGLVGETGCGKSVTALSILRLILPPGRIEEGRVFFKRDGNPLQGEKYVDLSTQTEEEMRKIRGNEISMIFQEPSSALNPVYSVNDQISESFLLHRREELCKKVIEGIERDIQKNPFILKKVIYQIERNICQKMLRTPNCLLLKFLSRVPGVNKYQAWLRQEAKHQTVKILRRLEIANPEEVVNRYPHELSGGMQQRIVIAMALACSPKLLIADEPTSNLDVTIQAQILDLIREIKERLGSSVLFITHDLGVVAEMCDYVAVMYAGNVCEMAPIKKLFKNPLHPYTVALMRSLPESGKKRLESIKGNVPNLINPPSGCRFHPRCSKSMPICSKEKPTPIELEEEHFVACHIYTQDNE
ncbi:MAG: ABC transporter ATP-binding protein [Candidatus Aerophobetes bacterium]|nr:ABC transporter ATP-binding protein [Candidatus Aerophobetes bacterium]